jgi:AcrR family transcriptional regulator
MCSGGKRSIRVQGTPYLYFKSKEALFLALHEEWDCGLAGRVNAAIAALPGISRRSPRQVLYAVATAVADHVHEESETCRVLMETRALAAHEPAISAAVQAADSRTHQELEGLFSAGIEAGEWPPGTDPALAARLFTGGPVRADGPVAPGTGLFLLERRSGRARRRTLVRPRRHGGRGCSLPRLTGWGACHDPISRTPHLAPGSSR